MIQTKDLLLKKADIQDWKDMYVNLWCHEESAKYMLWRPLKTEEEAKERIRKIIEYQKRNNFQYFVYEKKSGQAIGFAGMEEIEKGIYEDTGIAIGPKYTGKGYGKQILKGLSEYSFKNLGAYKFVCSCREKNIASRKMQLSCDFKYTHSEEKTDRRNGEKYILEFYEKLKNPI